ncbi:MAG: hypothetical protein ACFFB0_21695, partial [Promethearchaeota archaeon]
LLIYINPLNFMINIENYIHICRKFNKYKLPKLRFKELDERYYEIYKNNYNIEVDDINKASFIIFLTSLFIVLILTKLFTSINVLILFLFSVITALIIAYKFNLILYYEVNRNESKINSLLHLIKIEFSLIEMTLKKSSDNCLHFLQIIKNFRSPLSLYFKNILNKIHEGGLPERELTRILTPSNEFNNYLKRLVLTDFSIKSNDPNNYPLEIQFKIYLRELHSKISIIFFIGLFGPIGLCFLILFQIVNLLFLIFFIPFFLISLNLLFRKFIRKNSYMIGLLNEYSNFERKKFDEFLVFLKSFASNLKNETSPEQAFFKAYSHTKKFIISLKKPLQDQIASLLNFSNSFGEIIENLKLELQTIHYCMLLEVIGRIIKRDSYLSSDKIFEILKLINKHQKLEKKLEIIVKGEKFKIFFFIFLLPIIIGSISGFFPLFTGIIKTINLNSNILLNILNTPVNFFNVAAIFIILLSSVSITTNYFLKIINYNKRLILILATNIVYTLSFLISFISILSLI